MTFPLYFEASSKTADHEVGAVFTSFLRYISRFAPQPCGMPYICPLTELNCWSFRNGATSA